MGNPFIKAYVGCLIKYDNHFDTSRHSLSTHLVPQDSSFAEIKKLELKFEIKHAVLISNRNSSFLVPRTETCDVRYLCTLTTVYVIIKF